MERQTFKNANNEYVDVVSTTEEEGEQKIDWQFPTARQVVVTCCNYKEGSQRWPPWDPQVNENGVTI